MHATECPFVKMVSVTKPKPKVFTPNALAKITLSPWPFAVACCDHLVHQWSTAVESLFNQIW